MVIKQRVKGHLKPASSSRAAILSQTSHGNDDRNNQLSFGGFGSTRMENVERHSNLSIDEHVLIQFRHLLKKDETTKLKALNELFDYFEEKLESYPSTSFQTLFHEWMNYFRRCASNERNGIREKALQIELQLLNYHRKHFEVDMEFIKNEMNEHFFYIFQCQSYSLFVAGYRKEMSLMTSKKIFDIFHQNGFSIIDLIRGNYSKFLQIFHQPKWRRLLKESQLEERNDDESQYNLLTIIQNITSILLLEINRYKIIDNYVSYPIYDFKGDHLLKDINNLLIRNICEKMIFIINRKHFNYLTYINYLQSQLNFLHIVNRLQFPMELKKSIEIDKYLLQLLIQLISINNSKDFLLPQHLVIECQIRCFQLLNDLIRKQRSNIKFSEEKISSNFIEKTENDEEFKLNFSHLLKNWEKLIRNIDDIRTVATLTRTFLNMICTLTWIDDGTRKKKLKFVEKILMVIYAQYMHTFHPTLLSVVIDFLIRLNLSMKEELSILFGEFDKILLYQPGNVDHYLEFVHENYKNFNFESSFKEADLNENLLRTSKSIISFFNESNFVNRKYSIRNKLFDEMKSIIGNSDGIYDDHSFSYFLSLCFQYFKNYKCSGENISIFKDYLKTMGKNLFKNDGMENFEKIKNFMSQFHKTITWLRQQDKSSDNLLFYFELIKYFIDFCEKKKNLEKLYGIMLRYLNNSDNFNRIESIENIKLLNKFIFNQIDWNDMGKLWCLLNDCCNTSKYYLSYVIDNFEEEYEEYLKNDGKIEDFDGFVNCLNFSKKLNEVDIISSNEVFKLDHLKKVYLRVYLESLKDENCENLIRNDKKLSESNESIGLFIYQYVKEDKKLLNIWNEVLETFIRIDIIPFFSGLIFYSDCTWEFLEKLINYWKSENYHMKSSKRFYLRQIDQLLENNSTLNNLPFSSLKNGVLNDYEFHYDLNIEESRHMIDHRYKLNLKDDNIRQLFDKYQIINLIQLQLIAHYLKDDFFEFTSDNWRMMNGILYDKLTFFFLQLFVISSSDNDEKSMELINLFLSDVKMGLKSKGLCGQILNFFKRQPIKLFGWIDYINLMMEKKKELTYLYKRILLIPIYYLKRLTIFDYESCWEKIENLNNFNEEHFDGIKKFLRLDFGKNYENVEENEVKIIDISLELKEDFLSTLVDYLEKSNSIIYRNQFNHFPHMFKWHMNFKQINLVDERKQQIFFLNFIIMNGESILDNLHNNISLPSSRYYLMGVFQYFFELLIHSIRGVNQDELEKLSEVTRKNFIHEIYSFLVKFFYKFSKIIQLETTNYIDEYPPNHLVVLINNLLPLINGTMRELLNATTLVDLEEFLMEEKKNLSQITWSEVEGIWLDFGEKYDEFDSLNFHLIIQLTHEIKKMFLESSIDSVIRSIVELLKKDLSDKEMKEELRILLKFDEVFATSLLFFSYSSIEDAEENLKFSQIFKQCIICSNISLLCQKQNGIVNNLTSTERNQFYRLNVFNEQFMKYFLVNYYQFHSLFPTNHNRKIQKDFDFEHLFKTTQSPSSSMEKLCTFICLKQYDVAFNHFVVYLPKCLVNFKTSHNQVHKYIRSQTKKCRINIFREFQMKLPNLRKKLNEGEAQMKVNLILGDSLRIELVYISNDIKYLEMDLAATLDYPYQPLIIEKFTTDYRKKWKIGIRNMIERIILENNSLEDTVNRIKQTINGTLFQFENCVICYEVIDTISSRKIFQCEQCKNRQHSECVAEWFVKNGSTTCPICRAGIESID
ncbi:hypothetical protein SNEBB_007602 [Seison nebaliae]|nr:hypothetical protein SNEBB_007602 [Seison nebaliae]